MVFVLWYCSEGNVVVPHQNPNFEKERCDSKCLPGSLGIRRSASSLCEPDVAGCGAQVNMTTVASSMCAAWAHILPLLDPAGVGTQINQENALGSWLPCSVFCRTVTGTWYSPRSELAAFYLSAALPDGTLCYSRDSEQYYCQDALCLPIIERDNQDYSRNMLGESYDFDDELILDAEAKIVRKWGTDQEEDLNFSGYL